MSENQEIDFDALAYLAAWVAVILLALGFIIVNMFGL